MGLYGSTCNSSTIDIPYLYPGCFKLCNKVMWKRPQRVGGTLNGKSKFLQNLMRNINDTLFYMCAGLIMSKSRILDRLWSGISIWKDSGFGGKFKSQMRLIRYIIIQYAEVENGD